jgi:hypothetical protein
MIISWLKDLFSLKVPTIQEQEKVREQRLRNLVARYSRENINLCRGKYVTKEEIKKRVEKLSKYNFKSK